MRICLHSIFWWAPQKVFFLQECASVVEGHPRSLISVRVLSIRTEINDLGWPWTTDTHSCRKDTFWGAHQKNWMKTDPHYRRQKSWPMILVSRNIRCMRIFDGVPGEGSVKRHRSCRRQHFSVAVCSETLDRIYRIYTQDIQPLVGFSVIPKCMTSQDPE